jgi:hypothetical protein
MRSRNGAPQTREPGCFLRARRVLTETGVPDRRRARARLVRDTGGEGVGLGADGHAEAGLLRL